MASPVSLGSGKRGQILLVAAVALAAGLGSGVAAPLPAPPPCPTNLPGYACDAANAAYKDADGRAAGATATAAEKARGALLSTPVIVWTSVNDGADSTLDADQLDGLDSSQLVRSDRGGRIAGDLALDGAIAPGKGVVFPDGTVLTSATPAHATSPTGYLQFSGGCSWRTLSWTSLSLTTSGRPVFLSFSGSGGSKDGDPLAFSLRILADGKALPETDRYLGSFGTEYHIPIAVTTLVPLGAGTHTFEVQVLNNHCGWPRQQVSGHLSAFEI